MALSRFDQIIASPQNIIAIARAASGNSVLSFPAQQGKYGIAFAFSKYSYGAVQAENIGGQEQRGAIVLPVPTNLDESLSIGSKSTQLDYSGATAADVAKGMSTDDVFSYSSKAVGNAASAVGGANFDDVKAYAGFAARFLSGVSSDVKAGINVGTGVASNPYESVDFDGVRLKTHDFSWSLSPSSQAESDALRRIINTFKANALPNYTGIQNLSRLLMEFPSLVQIQLIGLDQSYYQGIFKPSLIQSVNVSYNDGPHLNVFAGGKPVTVDLKLQLIETQIHTRDEYVGE